MFQKGIIHSQHMELVQVKWNRELSGLALKSRWAGGIMENEPGVGGGRPTS